MEGVYTVLALEEVDIHGRGRIKQIIAVPFGDGYDR